jgi:hypothetical protein
MSLQPYLSGRPRIEFILGLLLDGRNLAKRFVYLWVKTADLGITSAHTNDHTHLHFIHIDSNMCDRSRKKRALNEACWQDERLCLLFSITE